MDVYQLYLEILVILIVHCIFLVLFVIQEEGGRDMLTRLNRQEVEDWENADIG